MEHVLRSPGHIAGVKGLHLWGVKCSLSINWLSLSDPSLKLSRVTDRWNGVPFKCEYLNDRFEEKKRVEQDYRVLGTNFIGMEEQSQAE